MQLSGKVALVTGSAQGIGGAIMREGAKVTVANIQEQRGRRLAKKLGGPEHCLFVQCEVGNASDVRHLVSETIRVFGIGQTIYADGGRLPLAHNVPVKD
jgi:NAD(P)-dependent dehydrogenase (short-subunit alcohol dehydrogenase family)